MNNVMLFKIGEDEFPIEIIDKDGQRWVARKQLGNALGVGNIKPLHSRLVERGELRYGTHWGNESLPQHTKNGATQYREMIIYSYRGIIRITMHSQGKRAMVFRDWAEDVLYEVMTTGTYDSENKKFSESNNFNSLCRMAEDDAALERMLRTRRKALTEIGFDEMTATFKSVESIRKDTGIDLSARFGFELGELRGCEVITKGLHKNASADIGSELSPEPTIGTKLHKLGQIPGKSDIPRTYRGWNLNKRGKNRKGEVIFNLTKKITGKKHQKYLGVWNQEKADRIIDEMECKYGGEESNPTA